LRRGICIGFLASVAMVAAAAAPLAQRPVVKSLHPDFAMLDAAGANVLASGRGVSTMKSCGQCHDTGFIASHASHVDLGLANGTHRGWDSLRYRFLARPGDERPDLSTDDWLALYGERFVGGGPATEMNCFVCHLGKPGLAARATAIRSGRFADASTSTLSGLGIVEGSAQGWKWDRTAFTAEGLVRAKSLALQAPANANCAACHGEVHPADAAPLSVDACNLDSPQTATTGQVIASQRIGASGLNLAGKAALTRSWDVHAERQLQCTDCHYSPNNPGRGGDPAEGKPAHLRHDPRALEIGAYLKRPDHDFAHAQGVKRACADCHDAAVSHSGWLPYVTRTWPGSPARAATSRACMRRRSSPTTGPCSPPTARRCEAAAEWTAPRTM
jgi:hypothetical protein